MKFTALLPMKLHSERVKGKNFREFKGKPLFEWMLSTMLDLPEIEKIVINTDGVEIFNEYSITSNSKVIVRNRPEKIRGDFVSMNRIIEDDLTHEDNDKMHFLMTHSTNPLISANTLKTAIQTYIESIKNGKDSLFSVNKFYSRFYNKNVEPLNHDPKNLIRTQDLDPIYEENSCFYIFSKNSFELTNARIGRNPSIFVTPQLESVDIDDYDSWTQAEINYEILNK